MKTKLRPRRILDVPLREVSGICLLRGRNHRMSLIAVGDSAAEVACLALPAGDPPLDWQVTNVAKFPGSKLPENDPQIEAICADGSGRVLLLQESPPRVELLDLEETKVLASIELVVEGNDELASSWSHPTGSRGEGVVLLPAGHLLVAKEKEPAALIEFGPPGSQPRGLAPGGAMADGDRWAIAEDCRQFVALATWLPDEVLTETCVDFSDLEIGPDGRLYLLSDQSATIVRLADLPVGGRTAVLTAAWQLDDLKGKPEGLSFAPDGRAIVAFDKRKRSRNLVLLEPAIAPPDGGA